MIDQASVLLNKTIVPPAEVGQEFFTAYSCAAQDTKRSITNSYIARKSIEFYMKNTFKESNILEEYNFYNERNLNRLKLFIENLLTETNKISPNLHNQSFLLTEENEHTLRSSDIKDRDLKVIREQMNELTRCLRHFLNSLGEITKAESKYMEGVEKSNLFKIDQKYKTNKQALFQESESLINFTNTLIYNLESVDHMIHKILTSQRGSIVIENNDGRRSARFENKGQQTDDAPQTIFDDKLSHISGGGLTTGGKDILPSGFRPLVSKENAPYSTNWDENNYFSEISEQREKRSPNKGLNLGEDGERKFQQLLQTNKALEEMLENKDENLKQTKRNLLKEVQDSNNLRIQLKKMIEENMQVKQKLDEALRLNDEFES